MSEDCTELVADGKLVRQMTGDDLRAEVKRLRRVQAAMTQERDELRRENEELLHIASFVQCYVCNAIDFCDNEPSGMTCESTLRAWAKKQAAQAGKEATK